MVLGIVSFVIILVMSRLVYLSSPRLILKWYGCMDIPSGEFTKIYKILDHLAGTFSVERPEIHLFESSVPVIFTVGSKKRSHIVFSRRVMNLLGDDELEIIFARELARIKEGNVAQNTFVAMVAGIIASLSTIALWVAMLTGFGQEDDLIPKFIRFVVMGIVMLPCSLIVYVGASDLTSKADVEVVKVMKNKAVLSSALKRLHNDILLNSIEYFNPGHVHLYVINPVKVKSFFDIHLSFFDMKPDLAARLKAIAEVDADIRQEKLIRKRLDGVEV
ncbi:M48 family metalloprotease [Methanolobus sediminis]|uniref:M48 family metalloprotease n=1 Tax=Methanolobus sediminis TaxID=3072978 RepID=A0AA51ULT0_9EURY|nr:M48 family metalloprotease [Methanolobus sediminis]WMW25443.1 M48 family metalloprotease [Methanolobus sediminis]